MGSLSLGPDRDRVLDHAALVLASRNLGGNITDQPGEIEMLQLRRGCTLVGKTEGPAAQSHGTVDGAQQRRRNPLHVGIGAVRHMIGNKLCRRQDIAQVVIDLSDCGPERCQPGALFERIAQAPLHLGQ